MTKLGYYDHLNKDPMDLPVTMEQIVTLVMSLNYGSHRFLSEWVRQREAAHEAYLQVLRDRGDDDIIPIAKCSEEVTLTHAVANALNRGGY